MCTPPTWLIVMLPGKRYETNVSFVYLVIKLFKKCVKSVDFYIKKIMIL